MSASNGETTTIGDHMTREKLRIVAALPAYNEEVAIGSVVLGARGYVDEVVVVDDGSSDRTAEIAEAAGAIVLKHEKNLGKGYALKSAFQVARELNADILVCLDGDGQHDPRQIPELVEPVKKGVDVVIGSRFLDGKHSVPKYRRLGQEFLTYMTNLVSSSKLTDSQSGYRAFSRNAIESLKFNGSGISIESEMQVSAGDSGLSVKEVPITCRYGKIRSTYNPIHHGAMVVNGILKLVEQRRPLLFFAVPGFTLGIIGAFMGYRVVDIYNATKTLAIGTALLTILFIMMGTLLFFTGVILHTVTGVMRKNGFNDLK
ncbi:MAG: glycosyltransferase family 2 protein [Archaeoglobaceae archaeon]